MKRSEQFKVRATEDQMNDLRFISEEMDLEMSTIIRALVDRFVAARKAHGPRLIWPPEFAHFAEKSKVVHQTAEEQPVRMVAEVDVGAFQWLEVWMGNQPAAVRKKLVEHAVRAGFRGSVSLVAWMASDADENAVDDLLQLAKLNGFKDETLKNP